MDHREYVRGKFKEMIQQISGTKIDLKITHIEGFDHNISIYIYNYQNAINIMLLFIVLDYFKAIGRWHVSY